MFADNNRLLKQKVAVLICSLLLGSGLSGCGLAMMKANMNLLESLELGTPKEKIVDEIYSSIGAGDCEIITRIDNETIEACPILLTMKNINNEYSTNKIFFQNGLYVGTGNERDILFNYFKTKELSDKQNSLIIITRIKSNKTSSEKLFKVTQWGPVNIYANGNKKGTFGSSNTLLFDCEPGEIKLAIEQKGRILNTVSWDITPKSKYNLIYDYSTGLITLEGDSSSIIKVTSDPPGAQIFAGKTPNSLTDTGRITPFSFTRHAISSTWASEYYQARMDGYKEPPTIFRSNSFGNREVHFKLTKNEQQAAIPPQTEPKKKPDKVLTKTGTGWITQGGYIVTNFHVIENQIETVLRFNSLGPESYPARIVVSDRHNDLAILQLVDKIDLKSPGLPLATSLPKIGADVFTIGYPKTSIMGNNPKVTNGIISSLSGIQDDPRIIQTTTAIQPGNSGGPLLDMKSHVVGVTTSMLLARISEQGFDVPQNVNYAVKAAYVSALLSSISENKDYPMIKLTSSKLEDIVPKLLDSIVQVIVRIRE